MMAGFGTTETHLRVLAVDTCTPTCSVAVAGAAADVQELVDQSGQTHARHLMGMAAQALSAAGVDLAEIDLLAVTRGPGSFTGLRIGISTVMGLSAATGKPAVGVSSLTTLATQAAGMGHWIVPMIDARRSEIYHGLFQLEDGKVVRRGEDQVSGVGQVVLPDARPALFIGNGAVNYRSEIRGRFGRQARFAPEAVNHVSALTVARLAAERYGERDGDPAQELAPVYLRRSDAEVNRERRMEV